MSGGYVVTVTPCGRVLPGDVWDLAQGGGEVVVQEVKEYFDAPSRAVFTDGMGATVSAMVSRGSWTLKSRKPVSRQEVDTSDQAYEAVLEIIGVAFYDAPTSDANDDLNDALTGKALAAVQAGGGTIGPLPDGSSITVEPKDGGDR